MLNASMAKVMLYQEDIVLVKFVGQDKYGKPIKVTVMNFVDVCQIKHEI